MSKITWQEVAGEVDGLATLPAGWDGYDADPIAPSLIAAAKRVIGMMPRSATPPPLVIPMTGGRLQWEWYGAARSLEIEFCEEGIHYLRWAPDEEIEEEGVFPGDDYDRILNLIRWFETRP